MRTDLRTEARKWVFRVIIPACLVAAAASCSSPGPSTVSDRRTRRIIVGVSPGGSQDLYARLLAPFLGRHLSGTPAVIVDNMPGAGGLIATNYLAHVAPADGTTLG